MDKKYPHTYQFMLSYTDKYLKYTKNFLFHNKKQGFSKKINALIEVRGSGFESVLTYPAHGKFVDSGRRKGAKRPPMKPIKDWIIHKGIKPLDPKTSISQLTFLFCRAIGRDGIKAVKFISYFEKKFENPDFKRGLRDACAKDMMDNIKI